MPIQLIYVAPDTSDVFIELYCFRPPCFAIEYVVSLDHHRQCFFIFVFADFESCRRVNCAVEKRVLGTNLYTVSYQSLGKISISLTSLYEVFPVRYFC